MLGEFSLTSGRRMTSIPAKTAVVLEILEDRITPSSTAGHWQGTLDQIGGPWEHYTLSLDLTQSGTAITGVMRLEVVGQPQYYEMRSVSGSVSGSASSAQATIDDGPITSQNLPPGYYWLTETLNFPIPLNVPSATVNGSWASGSESGEIHIQHTSGPINTHPALQITIPNNQTEFKITAEARMPTVVADLSLTGSNSDLSKTQVHWTAQVRFTGKETAHGVAGAPLDVPITTTGGHLVLGPQDWPRIRGGSLTLLATAMIDGQTVTTRLGGLRITGTNPSDADIRAALGSDVLRKIAHLESQFEQFGSDGYPVFSKDNLGGAGIMQITPPAKDLHTSVSEDQRWNWRANVQAGIVKYNDTYRLAQTYVASLRKSSRFIALVSATNNDRAQPRLFGLGSDLATRVARPSNPDRVHLGQPPLTIIIPDFTSDQRQKDAIRGYNGWAGIDPVDPALHLHEYRLALDSNGRLRLKIIAGTNTAEAIWEEVPVADRPDDQGDPDYVNHVLAETP